jgi:hypothetical protein
VELVRELRVMSLQAIVQFHLLPEGSEAAIEGRLRAD